jgi:hypothetical protein
VAERYSRTATTAKQAQALTFGPEYRGFFNRVVALTGMVAASTQKVCSHGAAPCASDGVLPNSIEPSAARSSIDLHARSWPHKGVPPLHPEFPCSFPSEQHAGSGSSTAHQPGCGITSLWRTTNHSCLDISGRNRVCYGFSRLAATAWSVSSLRLRGSPPGPAAGAKSRNFVGRWHRGRQSRSTLGDHDRPKFLIGPVERLPTPKQLGAVP